ncbi:S-adenosyl-L-methionine-dependent tRNA 4-demethylwyosine synthase, partial [Ceratobasidium sp. 370]
MERLFGVVSQVREYRSERNCKVGVDAFEASRGVVSACFGNSTTAANVESDQTLGRRKHTYSSPNLITIAYGTETGSSLDFATRLHEHLKDRSLEVAETLVELNDLDLTKTSGTLIVVTSSFGDGEAPSDASLFSEHINDLGASPRPLERAGANPVRFAVFGLGNSIWTKTYQQFPRWVDQTLERLGGTRILPLGEGDETAGTTEAAFAEFIRALSIAIEVGTQTLVSRGGAESNDEDDALTKPLGSSIGSMQEKFVDSTLVGRRALFDDDAAGSKHRA